MVDPQRVTVWHTCVIDGDQVDHKSPVTITEVLKVTLGIRYRGVRCDGSPIEWVEPA